MHFLILRAPCAVLLLAAAAAAPAVQAAGGAPDFSEGRAAGKGKEVRHWRDLAAGLGTRLGGGWTVAVNLTRVIGAGGGSAVYDRYATGKAQADARPWTAGAGHRSLVLSLNRRF